MFPSRAKARRRKRRPRPRGRRIRLALALSTILVVPLALGTLFVYVSVTSRFDGRLWQIPSRVYSDILTLRPGDRVSVDELRDRLLRSGYALVDTNPTRPGQFAVQGATLHAHLRAFRSPVLDSGARLVRIRFLGERIRAIEDEKGGAVRRAALEPELLATLYGPRQEERRPIELEEVPPEFIDAVLAAEDARFYEHSGIDLRGILRAAWVNTRNLRIVQGGSTITQQTVKNLYLHQRRTWWRKIRELVMATILDSRYSKERILEVYLNEVYLGQRGSVAICGAEAAARFYFGLPLQDLSLGEWALLAGMIRSPGRYNPFAHPERAIERRDAVLGAMLEQGRVEARAVESARSEKLRLGSGGGSAPLAPYAVDFVQAQLSELYPRALLETEGLAIYTSIDTRIQAEAETALARGLARLERDVPTLRRQAEERSIQGAVLVTRPEDGAIVALIGGRDYQASQFNRAVQARRQPGSCFKPLVYAAGFERVMADPEFRFSGASVLDDSPLELVSGGKSWSPSNYDREFRGPVTVRRALESSLNVPTVRAAQAIGLDAVIQTARRCGVVSPLAPLPSIALGTAELTPLELTTVYGTFAANGVRTNPWAIRAVLDAGGRRLEGRGLERENAISPETAFLISDLLVGVFERGTARSAAALGYRTVAAGKTGTTDETRDSWFVGFDDEYLALVWVGYDDNAQTGLTGASGALPIWVDLMQAISSDRAGLRGSPPSGLVSRTIDLETGGLAVGGCSEVAREYFLRGSEPLERCEVHGKGFRNWFRRLVRGRRGV